MGKVKQSNGKAAKGSKSADPLTTVKNAGITKTKSKGLAKDVAAKAEVALTGKKVKASKKPEPESDSESEASDDSESDDASDSDDSDSASEEEKPAAKTNGKAATNGKAKAKAAKAESSDSDDSSENDEDSDSSDDDADAAAKPAKASEKTNGKNESSDSDDKDSEDSDDSSDDDSEEAEKSVEQPKKRKAEEEESAPFKKTKTEGSEDEYTTLFVGNLGWGVDDDLLYETFKDCADLSSARVVTDKAMQRSRGFGYVDFTSYDGAKAAFEKMNNFELEGRPLRLDPSKPRPAEDSTPNARANNRAQQHGDTVSPESDTLFVGNLPFEADEDMVSAFFGETAEVKSLRLPTDPESGNRKGFGYVTFNSVEEAKNVFDSQNGAYIGQGRGARAIRLDFASQRPPREGGGRGGGGFGGRGGGGFGGRGGGRGGFGRGGPRGGGGRGGGRGGFGASARGGMQKFEGKKTTF